MKKLRIGTVPYVNIEPFVRALRGLAPTKVTFRHPSGLPELFDRGALDLCLLSVPEIFERGLEPLAGASISADGPVLSVVIQSRVPPARWERIALDAHSITSNRLAGVVVRDLLGLRPEFEVARDPESALRTGACDAAVLIGDRALRAHGRAATHDLSALWRALTGLPFVFAVWVPGPRCRWTRGELERLLEDAAARSPELVEETIDSRCLRLGVDPALLRAYLADHISYRFGPAERTGMEWFRRHLDPRRGEVLQDVAGSLQLGGAS